MKTTKFFVALLFLLSWMQGASAAHFDANHRALVGDANADGRQDIYLRFRPKTVPLAIDDIVVPIPQAPHKVGEFILQQNASGGGFSLLAAPSAAQLAAARQWQPSPMTLLLGDYNVDGNQDVLLKNVSQTISGGLDTFVFAPDARNATPIAVKSQDESFQTFVRDVDGWLNNPNYFDSGIRTETHTGYFRIAFFNCGGATYYGWADDPNLAVCFQGCQYLGYQWVQGQLTVRTFDPTGFSQSAINLLNFLLPYLNDPSLTPSAVDARNVKNILSGVLGTTYWPSAGTVAVPVPDAAPSMEALRRFLRILVAGARGGTLIGGIFTPSEVADATVLTPEQLAEIAYLAQAVAHAQVAQPGFLTFYHGSKISSATALLAGAPLSIKAALENRTFTGDVLGFYLATDVEVAEHWGAVSARGGPYGVLRYTLTTTAYTSLRQANAFWRPVPPITPHQSSAGYELVIPATAFPVFDGLRLSGQIAVTAAE